MSYPVPMRILYFLNSPGTPGGVEEHVRSLAESLPADRFDISLVCPSISYPMFRDLEGANRHVFCIDLFKATQFDAMNRLWSILRQQKIQIAHSHLFLATLYLAPLAKMAGVRFVVETPHVREAWRKSWWKRSNLIDRAVYTLVDSFIAVSRANQEYLIREKRCPSSKVHLIYNGRDLNHFQPTSNSEEELRNECGAAPSDVLILHVGRLENQKGHHFLFQALKRVRGRIQNIKVVLVGEGSLLESLKQECAQLEIADIVRFAGFQKDIRRFFEAADIVVLPSLWEGLPLVLIEAAAMGKAIIATRVDGNSEVVKEGETGFLVPPSDSVQLADAIVALGSSEPLRAQIGLAARRLAEERFSLRAQVQSTMQLYESLIQGIPTPQDHRKPVNRVAARRFQPETDGRMDVEPTAHEKSA